MQPNHSKSGILENITDQYWPQMELINLEGELISIVEKYDYLISKIDNNFDLNNMTKYRLYRGRVALALWKRLWIMKNF